MKWATASMNLELDDDGILYIVPPPDFEGPETLQHAEENIELLHSSIGKGVKGIHAIMPDHYVNVDATQHYRRHAPEVPCALVGNSFFKKMMGNFMLAISNTKRPIKMFNNEEEAMAWLKAKMSNTSS